MSAPQATDRQSLRAGIAATVDDDELLFCLRQPPRQNLANATKTTDDYVLL